MKKRHRKLQLHRETLRRLAVDQLGRVVGGTGCGGHTHEIDTTCACTDTCNCCGTNTCNGCGNTNGCPCSTFEIDTTCAC